MKKQNIIFLITLLTLFTMMSRQHTIMADEPAPKLGTPVFVEHGDTSATYTGCGGDIAPAINTTFEQRVVELVNIEREKLGLPPLKGVEKLYRSARYHATDMGEDDYFEHDSYDRVGGTAVPVNPACDFSDRIRAYNYEFISAAENIAAGQSSPEEVMTGWMNSVGHRANIERDNMWEIGVGYYTGSGSTAPYWVQNFGYRADVYPVIINNEKIETDSINVTLYIYGKWDEIRLQNDNDAWSDWKPFTAPTINWTINNVVGERLVSVEMRKTGQTTFSNDVINLTMLNSSTATPTPSPSATLTPTPSATLTSSPSATLTPTATDIPTGLPTATPIATTPGGRPTADIGSTATPTGTSLPTATTTVFPSTPGPRPTVDAGGVISGVVRLQSRTDYTDTQILLSEVTCANAVPSSGTTATTDSIGHFEISPPAGQTIQCLYVVHDKFLAGQKAIPRGDLGKITLLAGDINQDNIVDILDVAYVGLRYNGNDLTADINSDNKVNIFDVAIVSRNYKKQGPLTDWQ